MPWCGLGSVPSASSHHGMPSDTLLSIDPGVRYLALAYWRAQTLVSVAVVRGGTPARLAAAAGLWAPYAARIAVEWPRSYRGRRAPERDLEGLRRAVVATEVWYRANSPLEPTIRRYYPSTWKGQVPKRVHRSRIDRELTQNEKNRSGAYQSDIWDAIGIGLFALGRVGVGGARLD